MVAIVAGRVKGNCCMRIVEEGMVMGSCRRVEIGMRAGCRKVESGAGRQGTMIDRWQGRMIVVRLGRMIEDRQGMRTGRSRCLVRLGSMTCLLMGEFCRCAWQ